MDIQKLRIFCIAAQAGSFSEAAEQLYSTQSSVTKQIKSLESELGVLLFDRSHRRPELTEAGRTLLPLAGKVLDDYSAMLSALRSKPHTEIFSIPVMAQYGITSLVSAFKCAEPGNPVSVFEREARDIPALLEKGECELAFVRVEQLPAARFDCIGLFPDRLVAAVSEKHSLAGSDSIALSALRDESFLLMDKETGILDVCLEACRRSGFSPHISYTGKRAENILALAAAGEGTALLMERAAAYLHVTGIKLLELDEPVLSTVGLARLRGRRLSSSAQALWEYACGINSRTPLPDDGAPL